MANSLLSSEMARAHDALFAAIDTGEIDSSSKFTWRGNDYPCIGVWNETGFMNAGGIVPLDDLTIQVLKSEFDGGPLPQRLDSVTFQGKVFRIEIIQHSPGDYIKYTCYDPAKGS